MHDGRVLRQKDWSEQELIEAGFKYFHRIKQVVRCANSRLRRRLSRYNAHGHKLRFPLMHKINPKDYGLFKVA